MIANRALYLALQRVQMWGPGKDRILAAVAGGAGLGEPVPAKRPALVEAEQAMAILAEEVGAAVDADMMWMDTAAERAEVWEHRTIAAQRSANLPGL